MKYLAGEIELKRGYVIDFGSDVPKGIVIWTGVDSAKIAYGRKIYIIDICKDYIISFYASFFLRHEIQRILDCDDNVIWTKEDRKIVITKQKIAETLGIKESNLTIIS